MDPNNDETKLNHWLEGDEISQITEAFNSEPERPGEQQIVSQLLAADYHRDSQLHVAKLESKVKRWRLATILASTACVVIALLLNLPEPTKATLDQTSTNTSPKTFDTKLSNLSQISARVSKSRQRLTTLTNSTQRKYLVKHQTSTKN